jgi:TldD protein
MTSPASLIDRAGLDRARLSGILHHGLEGADDGELYLEYRQSEVLVFDNGRLKQATYDTAQGFGLRAVKDEAVGYAHASDVSEEAIRRAADSVRAVKGGYSGRIAEGPARTNVRLYTDDNPLASLGFEAKVKLLQDIDAYARAKDARVRQVSASVAASWQVIEILRPDGEIHRDVRPLVRLNVSIVSGAGDRQETGSHGYGGRETYERFVDAGMWRNAVDDAVRQAMVNLESVPAPAGEMDVVLGSGWPGVMLHEAVGHGLEGDFNRKKTSAFAGLMGRQVAAKGVTVVDDGTMASRRGSLSIDDEGTPTNRTVLIEDGILVGYMQDRQNARLMNMRPTGNGRRESYGHVPMPRMTNTYMLSGGRDPAEILASVKNGIYAVSFGGGQVDITSGKYVFQCTEAYRLENGKIGAPVKGAMLIGTGPCGKNGQGVPVGVGQPTLRMEGITVGGTGG